MTDQQMRDRWCIVGALLLAGGVIFSAGGCDLTDPVSRESLVVEAFLETGQALPTITLRQTRPLHEPGRGVGDAATGATVDLAVNGRTVPYEEGGRPGRYQPAADSGALSPRTPWQLTVRWDGETAQAEGETPPPIRIEEMCVEVPAEPVQAVLVDSLRRDSLDIPAEQGYLYPVDVTVRWSSDGLSLADDTTHWVRPRLNPDTTESSSRVVSFFLQPDEVRREDRFRVEEDERQWMGVYAVPVEDSTSTFPRHDLTATLVRGDTSFAAFARSRNDPERREPISNVTGGLGIATAVATDSLRRAMVPGINRCWSP